MVAAAEAETAQLRREAHAATLAALKVMCVQGATGSGTGL